jgi:hypothetical protein
MTKTLECALGLAALLALVGCYNTNSIKNGGLVCGTGSSCPSGFVCANDGPVGSAGHCWKNGTGPAPDAGGGNPDTASPKTDADLVQACAVGGAPAPYGPFATCSANQPIAGSTCDPICQAGCPCNRRCVLDATTNTSFICEASAPPAGTAFVPPLGACNGTSVGLCAPGSVCTNDDICQYNCHKTCRTDQDCGTGSRCTASTIVDATNQPVNNLFFCSPPTETCNPTGTASCGTARANFNCVFLAGLTGVANSDSTVCDCSTSHNKGVGQACALLPDDCQPGLVCVASAGNPTCRQVCSQKAPGSACPSGGGCNSLYGSLTYGYCR